MIPRQASTAKRDRKPGVTVRSLTNLKGYIINDAGVMGSVRNRVLLQNPETNCMEIAWIRR